MAKLPQQPPIFEQTFLAVGTLCYEWANLEQFVCDSLVWAARIQAGKVSRPLVRCFDFRDQLAALKLALIARVKHHESVDALVAAIDYVDNFLRPRRNRYIHDAWFIGERSDKPGVLRTYRSSYSAKIERTQAHKPRTWKWDMQLSEYDDLVHTIEEVREHAWFIFNVAMALKTRRRLAKLLAKPPQRRFLPRRNEKPPKVGSAGTGRQRQRQSSLG